MTERSGLMNLLSKTANGERQLIKLQGSAENMLAANFVSKPVTIASVNSKAATSLSVGSANIKMKKRNSSADHAETKRNVVPQASPSTEHSTMSRKRQEVEKEAVPDKRSQGYYNKRRRVDKCGKGLRHFSMKVCEKVKNKGTTTYNEVADELVAEFTNPAVPPIMEQQYDQKNIRRRVYDALNVLMAMNIISKEKKEIKWLGLPTNSLQECLNLVDEKKQRIDRVKQKTKQLQEIILQQICFKRLVERNFANEQMYGRPLLEDCAVHLPFLLLRTSKDTVINISVSQDKQEYHFVFDDNFEIRDDVDILKEMGLVMGLDKGQCTEENLEIAKSVVPEVLKKYVEQMATGDTEVDMDDLNDEVDSTARMILEPSCSPERKIDSNDDSDTSSDADV